MKLGLVLLAVAAGGCATAPSRPPVDLTPARKALETARKESTAEPAKGFASRAEEHLEKAEKLAVSPDPGAQTDAHALALVAEAEADAASALARLAREAAPAPEPVRASGDPERDKLRARLARAVEEQKKLEEKAALLQHDLDATETELIRTKAKLKGIETKAEASSAIAEARILILRLQDEKSRSAAVGRSQEKLERAERQLREGNYGAAVFFALQAQELLDEARHAGDAARKK